jgi:hypothetical protein
MKAYVIVTGGIFGLLTIAHLLRMVTEDSRFARDPVFVLITLISTALCVWACRLVWSSNRR